MDSRIAEMDLASLSAASANDDSLADEQQQIEEHEHSRKRKTAVKTTNGKMMNVTMPCSEEAEEASLKVDGSPAEENSQSTGIMDADDDQGSNTEGSGKEESEELHSPPANDQPPIVLPPRTSSTPNYTLVLDLDGTLVHSLGHKPPQTYATAAAAVKTFEVSVEGWAPHYIRVRPHVKEFLERLAPFYEIVLFTAGLKEYAHAITRLLDPEGRFIRHLLTREHCLVPKSHSNVLVKDLRILGRDLQRVVIIDDRPESFACQVDNGILIRSWWGDRDNDEELLKLIPFLVELSSPPGAVSDVREVIKRLRLNCGFY